MCLLIIITKCSALRYSPYRSVLILIEEGLLAFCSVNQVVGCSLEPFCLAVGPAHHDAVIIRKHPYSAMRISEDPFTVCVMTIGWSKLTREPFRARIS